MPDDFKILTDQPEENQRTQLLKLIDSMYLSLDPLPLDEQKLVLFTQYFSGQPKWESIRYRWFIEQNRLRELKFALNNLQNEQDKLSLLIYLSNYCYQKNKCPLGIYLANMAYKLEPTNLKILRILTKSHQRVGNISERFYYLKKIKSLKGKLYGSEYRIAKDERKILQEKLDWNQFIRPMQNRKSMTNVILHVLSKSWTKEINGYTIRSEAIIKQQKKMGYHPIVVTKLGWPEQDFLPNGIVQYEDEGISTVHLYGPNKQFQLNHISFSTYASQYARKLTDVINKFHPKVIHAASNFQNAFPALAVANKLGIPSVYEVRGLWHYTQSSKTPGFENSERYQLHTKYELLCCQMADQVVTICDSLKNHIIELGIPKSKISVVPNGVDTVHFSPIPTSQQLIDKYNLEGHLVLGFVGSITVYEGLNYLLEATAELIYHLDRPVKLFIIGDGPALNDLKELATRLNLVDHVIFTGMVSHSEVTEFYSIIDVFPFPRINHKVCQLVTPIKPLEALAMEKIVLISDVAALKEQIIPGQTGLVFQPENVASLVDCIHSINQYEYLGVNARKSMIENRDWHQIVKKYHDIYSRFESNEQH